MAQKTQLSVLGLPGAIHSFLAKTEAAAAVTRAFGDAVLSIAAKLAGSVTNETKLAGTGTVEPIHDGTISINE